MRPFPGILAEVKLKNISCHADVPAGLESLARRVTLGSEEFAVHA
jgi:hypothetical protein